MYRIIQNIISIIIDITSKKTIISREQNKITRHFDVKKISTEKRHDVSTEIGKQELAVGKEKKHEKHMTAI